MVVSDIHFVTRLVLAQHAFHACVDHFREHAVSSPNFLPECQSRDRNFVGIRLDYLKTIRKYFYSK